jgi:hypothetical protein
MSVKVNLDLEKEFKKRAKKIRDQEANKLIEALKEVTPVDTGKARDGWQYEDGVIFNDVEYISDLNSGSSQQAPSHFIEKTLLENKHAVVNGTLVVQK